MAVCVYHSTGSRAQLLSVYSVNSTENGLPPLFSEGDGSSANRKHVYGTHSLSNIPSTQSSPLESLGPIPMYLSIKTLKSFY